jgi:cell division protein FtsB
MKQIKKAQNKFSKLIWYFGFWAFIIISFSVGLLVQLNQKTKYEADIKKLEQELKFLENQQTELRRKLEYNKSDEFAEEYAHNEFGLAYSDEIIFYNDSYTPRR